MCALYTTTHVGGRITWSLIQWLTGDDTCNVLSIVTWRTKYAAVYPLDHRGRRDAQRLIIEEFKYKTFLITINNTMQYISSTVIM